MESAKEKFTAGQDSAKEEFDKLWRNRRKGKGACGGACAGKKAENTDHCLENFDTCRASEKEAFDEVCSTVEALHTERRLREEAARTRYEAMRAYSDHLREKHKRLRERYVAIVAKYNELAEAAHDRSDSSSSSDEEEKKKDKNCKVQ